MTIRRWNVVIVVALLCALAVVITLVVRSHSSAHRADAALDDLRSLPGVSTASAQNYPESGDSPRDAVVTVSESATTAQVAKVLTGAEKAAEGDAISEVSVRVGAAYAAVGSSSHKSAQAAPPLVALAALSHGSALVNVATDEPDGFTVQIDPDGLQPVGVATAALKLLQQQDSPLGNLVVGTVDSNAVVMISGSTEPATRVLNALQSQQKRLRRVRVDDKRVSVTARPGVSTVDLHRALAPVVRSALPGEALVIEGGDDQLEIEGTGSTTTITDLEDQLKSRDLRLTRVDTDRSRVDVASAKDDLTAKDAPDVRRALASLDPALPADCDISIERSAGGLDDVFNGTPAQLSRMAPKLAAAAAKGYEVSWDGDRQVEVVLPPGTDLTTKTAKPAMQLARSLGWSGAKWVQIGERADDKHDRTESLRFESTANGTTSDMNGSADDAKAFARVWNATATSGKGPSS